MSLVSKAVGLMVLALSLAGAALGAGNEAKLDAGFVNPGYHEQPSWFKNSFLDIREDVADAAASGKRVLLYFYQDGCPYCERLLSVNFAQRELVEKTRSNFDVIAINLWGDREVTDRQGTAVKEKRFAADLGVQFTPTLVFLNEQGQVVLRINGYYPPHKFDTALDYVAGRHEKAMTYRDFYAARNPAPATGTLHQEAGFLQPPYRLAQREGGRPLLVLFEQKDCKACDELHVDAFSRAETRALLDRFDVALLDIWSKTPVQTPAGEDSTAAEWAKALDIQYAPSMVFFVDGREVFRTEAYLRPFHTQSVLDYVASGAYREQPEFQRFVQARADVLREKGVEVNLWQ